MNKYYNPERYENKLGYRQVSQTARDERNYENYAGEYVATEEILKHRAAQQAMPERKHQLTTAHMLNLLNSSLDRLHEEISALENAITPVLRSPDPITAKDSPQEGNHAAVNLSLICLNERIGYEIERIEDLYKRAEVV